jgi:hypothetical protein
MLVTALLVEERDEGWELTRSSSSSSTSSVKSLDFTEAIDGMNIRAVLRKDLHEPELIELNNRQERGEFFIATDVGQGSMGVDDGGA